MEHYISCCPTNWVERFTDWSSSVNKSLIEVCDISGGQPIRCVTKRLIIDAIQHDGTNHYITYHLQRV